MSVVALKDVSFAYRKNEPVVQGINMDVPKSCIYGFLGANGAGKSTTLRLILGLMAPEKGSISIFQEDIKTTYPHHLKRIGSMIESASLYEHLSAKDNLKIAGRYFSQPESKIAPMLELVNLAHAKKKKVKDFSTGMKQRLGLAIALQHDPELLILDEPTNGLDPNGIIELREVVHRLKEEGKTILLSSHILSEVEKIVDRVGIINDGQIAFEGSLQELQALRSKNSKVKFRVSDTQRIKTILPQLQIDELTDHNFVANVSDEQDLAGCIKSLVEQGIDIYEVSPVTGDLEDMFLSIVNS